MQCCKIFMQRYSLDCDLVSLTYTVICIHLSSLPPSYHDRMRDERGLELFLASQRKNQNRVIADTQRQKLHFHEVVKPH